MRNHPSRIASEALAETTWHGPLCKRGHTLRRIAAPFRCVECESARNSEIRPDASYHREWRANNPMSAENREKKRARDRIRAGDRTAAWKVANPEGKRSHDRTRRARAVSAEGTHTAADIRALAARQRGLCAYCDAPWEHVDHIIPLAHPLKGSNWPENLQLLCAFHNVSKGARTDGEYRDLQGWPETGKPIPLELAD